MAEPCVDGLQLIARDNWTGGDDADIDGRMADGGDGSTPDAAAGQWEPHPDSDDTIAIVDGVAVPGGFGYPIYGLKDVAALTAAQMAETIISSPERDVPTGTAPGPFCVGSPGPAYVPEGTNPDHGDWHPGAIWQDCFTIWFTRPANSTVTTLETTLPNSGIFIKLYYEVDGSGIPSVYRDLTYPAGDIRAIHLNESHERVVGSTSGFGAILDYCNYLGIDVYEDEFGVWFDVRHNTSSMTTGASKITDADGTIEPGTTDDSVGSPSYSGASLYPRKADVATGGLVGEYWYQELVIRGNNTNDQGYWLAAEFTHNDDITGPTIQFWCYAKGPTGGFIDLRVSEVLPVSHGLGRLRWSIDADAVLRAWWDYMLVFEFDLINDLAYETGLTAPLITDIGRPYMTFFGTDAADVQVTQFSLYIPCEDSECAEGTGTSGAEILASDAFDGADTSDIDTRVPDGNGTPALEEGVWAKNPATDYSGSDTEDIGIADNVGVKYGSDGLGVVYVLKDIPGLGADYRAVLQMRAPDPGTSTTPGGLCGSGEPSSNPVQWASAVGHDTFQLRLRWVGGAGTATVSATLSDGSTLAVRTEIQSDGTVLDYGSWKEAGGTVHTFEHVFNPSGVIDIGTAPIYCLIISVDCAGTTITRRGLEALIGTARPTSVTISSTSWSVTGGLEAYNHHEDSEDDTAAPIWAGPCVRYDETTDTGYQINRLRDLVELYEVNTGTFALLRSFVSAFPLDTDEEWALEAEGTLLRVYKAGVEIPELGVDYATDLDDSSNPIIAHDTGLPGLTLQDLEGIGRQVLAVLYTVTTPGSVGVPCIPCEGPPENPYPRDPPPIGPVNVVAEATMQRGAWRPVVGPGPGVTDPAVFPSALGALRGQIIGQWVEANGVWRLVETTNLEQLPPPDTTLPPYFDPCERLDPDPGGTDFPPIGDVEPIPYAGGRFFGMHAYPITMFNSVFNATQTAAEMPYFLTSLSQATARSGVIVGAQGGYKKFVGSNGYYSQTLMNNYIDSHAASASTILAAQAAGRLPCIIAADDFRVQALWPTSLATGGGDGRGLSDTELARIAARWQVAVPGIRLALRARPRIFSAPIPGISVYLAQFDGPVQVNKRIGDTITEADYRSWRNAECAKVRSWPAGITIIMSINYLAGSDSDILIDTHTFFGTRPIASPGEIVRAADGWFGDGGGGYDDLIIGSCGYTYLPMLFGVTGWLDAMVYHRNGLMSLSPL